jgi:hypothetical protein
MTDVKTDPTAGTFRRRNSPGVLARLGALIGAVADAVAEANALRRDAQRRYPHLSYDA